MIQKEKPMSQEGTLQQTRKLGANLSEGVCPKDWQNTSSETGIPFPKLNSFSLNLENLGGAGGLLLQHALSIQKELAEKFPLPHKADSLGWHS